MIQFQEENSETYCQGSTREVSFPQWREKSNPIIALFFYYSTLYHTQIYSSLNCTALPSNTGNFWQKIHRHAVWKYITFFSKQRQEGRKNIILPFTSLLPPFLRHAAFMLIALLLGVIIDWLRTFALQDKAPLIVSTDQHFWLLFLSVSTFLTFHSPLS